MIKERRIGLSGSPIGEPTAVSKPFQRINLPYTLMGTADLRAMSFGADQRAKLRISKDGRKAIVIISSITEIRDPKTKKIIPQIVRTRKVLEGANITAERLTTPRNWRGQSTGFLYVEASGEEVA